MSKKRGVAMPEQHGLPLEEVVGTALLQNQSEGPPGPRL
jgi:hypothetical protein